MKTHTFRVQYTVTSPDLIHSRLVDARNKKEAWKIIKDSFPEDNLMLISNEKVTA